MIRKSQAVGEHGLQSRKEGRKSEPGITSPEGVDRKWEARVPNQSNNSLKRRIGIMSPGKEYEKATWETRVPNRKNLTDGEHGPQEEPKIKPKKGREARVPKPSRIEEHEPRGKEDKWETRVPVLERGTRAPMCIQRKVIGRQ